MLYRIVITLLILTSLALNIVRAEPWLDTRDAWLRADIEALSSAGIINSPITTWPLPWARVVKDLESFDSQLIPKDVFPAYMRVKRKARLETDSGGRSQISLKGGNQSLLLRNFGDDRREKAEITTKNTGLNADVAWNIEVTKAIDPLDGDELRLDHSYVAAIWGNWIFSAGTQERWYGPSWDSSLILSNNARPVPSLSIQRNYSDPFETPWLSWMGPWSLSAFAGQLESDRFVPHAKILGMSATFKPFDSLEIGLRRTAQWGGEGRPESLSSLIDLAIGRTNCDEIDDGCDDRLNSSEAGNQLAGVDFNWQLPISSIQTSLYGQLVGEDEAGFAPSRKFYQLGVKNNFVIKESLISSFIEYSDTENEYEKNVTYEHAIYQTGYRFKDKSLGSTYDNDTKAVTLGILMSSKSGSRYSVKVSSISMNSSGNGDKHSINGNEVEFNRLAFSYQVPLKYGIFGVNADIKDKKIDSYDYQNDKFNIGVTWTMDL